MFNLLLSIQKLFILSLSSFFIILTIRQLCIKRKIFIFSYYGFLFIVFFGLALGGGGVQNANYGRLEKFVQLEKNNQLEQARNNPEKYDIDKQLQFDLEEYRNSNEFRSYIQQRDSHVDREEAVLIGWLLAFLAEISRFIVMLFNVLFHRIKNKQ